MDQPAKPGRPPLEPRIAELERKIVELEARMNSFSDVLKGAPLLKPAAVPLHSAQNATWRP